MSRSSASPYDSLHLRVFIKKSHTAGVHLANQSLNLEPTPRSPSPRVRRAPGAGLKPKSQTDKQLIPRPPDSEPALTPHEIPCPPRLPFASFSRVERFPYCSCDCTFALTVGSGSQESGISSGRCCFMRWFGQCWLFSIVCSRVRYLLPQHENT